MRLKKAQIIGFSLALKAFLLVECCAMDVAVLRSVGVDTDAHTASWMLQNNCQMFFEYRDHVRESGMSAKDFMTAKLEYPQTTIVDIRRYFETGEKDYKLGKHLLNLCSNPTFSQKTAGRYLFQLARKEFTLEDLIATVYLQTNDKGRGGLGALLPTPSIDQIDASKYLLALPLVSFTQEDLKATVHLRTNPGNVWDEPILNPMREEIQAAKTLRARAPQYTKAELLQEWQRQVTDEITPKLLLLAEASKKRAVLYFDEERARLKDAEAAQLIQAVPQLLHAALRANYDQLKRDFVITDAHLEAALAEVRQIAAEVFG
ncbi:MAG: hypothetical protein K2Y18_06215 [Alphaproteobacteria bacterium]|jgi:hypothetical protein|nr:hypothetical protein [Alphaproteobacteria bacterium]